MIANGKCFGVTCVMTRSCDITCQCPSLYSPVLHSPTDAA